MTGFFRQALRAAVIAVFLAGAAMPESVYALTLQEAARQVARQYDARVISAHTVERNGQRIHVIRIMTKDNVVRTIRVPAGRG